ncbi:sensor domain-containing diguanylate cyclase [Frankia sp. EAN1pec]|uniref:diguanylate cyclase domain-containing protein n=1 Tax=Parafrankia sp. (strain EAN1pec) TaxID=298653 RepID=UPI00059BACD2
MFDRLEIGLSLTCLRNRQIWRVNAAMCDILGRSRFDLIGGTWDALEPPPDGNGWEDVSQLLNGERIVLRHLTRFARLDGSVIHIVITTRVEKYADEPCCLGQILDVTDAAVTRDQLQLILENSPVSMGLTDLSGRILVSGGGSVPALAEDLEAAGRTSIFEVFKHTPDTLTMMRRAMDGEPSIGMIQAYGHSYDLHIRPIRNPAGQVSHVASIATDVTERERAHDEQSTVTELAHQALQIVEPERLWNHAAAVLASRLDAAVTVHMTEPGHGPDLIAAVGVLPPAPVTAAAVRDALLIGPPDQGNVTGARNLRRTGRWLTVSLPLGRPNAPAAILTIHRTDRELHEDDSQETAAEPFTPGEVEFVDAVASVLGAAAVRFAMEREANYRALHDSLTDLPNRVALLDRLKCNLEQSRSDGLRTGVIFIDLDGFKIVNDSLGHLVGDDVLREVADRLRASARPNDVVARLAGDEFAILCEQVSTIMELERAAHGVITALAKPIALPEADVTITASAGVAISGTGLANADRLLNASDVAMYVAKRAGPGHCVAYQPAMRLDQATSPAR